MAERFTQAEKEQIRRDLFDPDKVNIHCDKHMYFGPGKSGFGTQTNQVAPTKGCPDCWFVFYFVDIAQAPPSERQARLDELEYVVRNMISLDEKGKFDFQPYDHAQISITKEDDPLVSLTDSE